MTGVTRIEVNKGCNVFFPAVFVDSVGTVGGIQEKIFNPEFRKVCFHGEKGMQERKHIMAGSPFQKRKHREVAVGIGGHIHVEVVTEEIAFSVRVPAPVALWLRIMTFAGAGKASTFLTFAGVLFSLLCGSPDRSAVTGKSQMLRINQSLLNGTIQELLLIKPENNGKRIFRFQFPAFQ